FGAARAVAIWSESEEPWTWVSRLEGGVFAESRLAPDAYGPAVAAEAGEGPFLFEETPGRLLARAGARRKLARALAAPIDRRLAADLRLERGLRIPIRSDAISGELFLTGVPGLCSDDIERAEQLAAELSAALEHRELIRATEAAAAIRARLALARDLHDSVAQFLAGLAFRLEALRKTGATGADVAFEVDALQDELGRQQQDLRHLIAELREGPTGEPGDRADLVASLRGLTGRIAAQWGVACPVAATPARIEVPLGLERNVHQLVREAVANAVRHGHATSVRTRLRRATGTLEVEISDNGSGFPRQGELTPEELAETGPSSLRERVHNLGGRLRIASAPSGSRLSMALPLEEAG
ncbi:MAG: sensor histidine kinase, partial [Allosphingosinicella sp.]